MKIDFKDKVVTEINHLNKKYNHFEHTDFYSTKEMLDIEFKFEDGTSLKLLSDCENAHNQPYGVKPSQEYLITIIALVAEQRNKEMTVGEFIEEFFISNVRNQVIVEYEGEQGLLVKNSPHDYYLNSLFTLQDMESARALNSIADKNPLVVLVQEGESVVKMTVDQFIS